jgi:arabinan endo-1,5-alpha-L-arabinosidase
MRSSSPRPTAVLLSLLAMAAAPVSQPTTGPVAARQVARLGSRGVRIHDPSTIVKCGDEYWVFATALGVRSYHSKDLLKWEPGPRLLDEPPAWARDVVPAFRGNYLWAPDVIEIDHRYWLFYSVSTFGKNASAIGVASNATLDPADARYKWSDRGVVVRSSDLDDFNAIDPAVTLDADGELWLTFGSFWSGIKLVQLDRATCKPAAGDLKLISLAKHKSIEAPYIYRHDGRYYLFVNWGLCCRGTASTYEIRVGRASAITGPYVDRDGKDMRDGGGTLLLGADGPFIGPGHASILRDGKSEWFACHFYDATQGGRGTFAIRPLTWSKDGWPIVGIDEKR